VRADCHPACVIDIHPILQANILVDERGEPRLTDFGLTEVSATEDTRRPPGNCSSGSWRWMAPELHQEGGRKSRKADIYAFGMVIIEVIKSSTECNIPEETHLSPSIDLHWTSTVHRGRSESLLDRWPSLDESRSRGTTIASFTRY
jgi:serine/threonine protein kinase